jgi:hypothetical protein
MSALKNASNSVHNQMFRTRCISSVLTFASNVPMNVQNTTIQNVKNVLMFVASALKHVIKLLKQKRTNSPKAN